MTPPRCLPLALAVAIHLAPYRAARADDAAAAAEGLRLFEQRVRPMLVEHCYSCHSSSAAEKKNLKAGLYLDTADGLRQGGESGPAIAPGKPGESLLLQALRYESLEMPPAGRLDETLVADVARWIELGAPDPRTGEAPRPRRAIDVDAGREFWSFQPLGTPAPPVAGAGWATTPIDAFVAAKLAEQGLSPNPAAAPETLLRRVYLDLIGLPPTPEQLDAFLADPSPAAYERVVDELLRSERYGERWGRHWLDVARYAESGGYEFDGFRPGAYHYRDWVIRSLNADLPYDEFLRMQLAGDLLHPDVYEGAAAAGFLVAGPYPGQITAKTVERIRYDQLDDMLMTTGGAMLGLTLGCVRCHEHKYDPIPQRDYYALAATLATTAHGPRTYDPDPEASERALAAHLAAQAPLEAALADFVRDQLPTRFETWRQEGLPTQPETPRWQTLLPWGAEAERSWLRIRPDGVVAHDGGITPGTPMRGRGRAARSEEQYTVVTRTYQKAVTALRLDLLSESSLPNKGPGLNGDGSFQLAELRVTARPLDAAEGAALELKLKPLFAAREDDKQPLAQAVDGKPNTAWVVRTTAGTDNAAVFEIEGGLAGSPAGVELKWELRFRDQGVGRLRLSLSNASSAITWAGDVAPQPLGEIRALLAEHKQQIPAALHGDLSRWFAPFDSETARLVEALDAHRWAAPRPPYTEVYTTISGGQDVYLLRRGEVDNKLGKASPGFVQVLSTPVGTSPVAVTEGEASGTSEGGFDDAAATALFARWIAPQGEPPAPRVALASWITDAEHGAGALAARVIVNRLWQHHLGAGLVGTPNDFGEQGERPSHPELLDWLARELVQSGWRLKPLHKQIVISATYRQSHDTQEAGLRIDPENRLLWQFRPRRLEAETIRDALLSVGGNLDTTMYGPSVLDNTTRRGVYLRVKRSELIPWMTTFDAPEPTQSIGERTSTTVPTQALTMLNSPFVRRQAELLAARVRPPGDAASRMAMPDAIGLACRTALGRRPGPDESQQLLEFVEQQRAELGGDPATLDDRALIELCHALLCLNEFVFLD